MLEGGKKMRIKPVNIMQGFIFVIFMYSLFCTQSYFGTADYMVFSKLFPVITIACCIAIMIKKQFYLSIERDFIYKSALLYGPYAIVFLFSLLLVFVNPGLSFGTAYDESIAAFLYSLAGAFAYYYFREKLIDIVLVACLTNYTLYIVEFLRIYGPLGLLHYVELTDAAPTGHRPLEVHEVTFVLGFIFVYYILKYGFTKKWQLIISGIYIILGYKRILLFSLILGIILYYFLKNKKNNLGLAKIVAAGVLCICIIWTVFTSTDWYLLLSYVLNIELNGRDNLMARVRELYTISPFYLGHGVGYVHTFMINLVRTDPTASVSALHNDILKYYIDLGCIPALLFFTNMILWNTVRFGKIEKSYAVKYVSLITMLMICWMTDNLAGYPNFIFAFNAMILSLVCEKKNGIIDNE